VGSLAERLARLGRKPKPAKGQRGAQGQRINPVRQARKALARQLGLSNKKTRKLAKAHRRALEAELARRKAEDGVAE